MAKTKKSTGKEGKKWLPKNSIRDMIKQSVEPPPKAITPPEESSRKKNSKKIR